MESKNIAANFDSKDVKEGDWFSLTARRFSPAQRKLAMQVMEVYPHVMTVKCKGGCTTKPYSDFDKIDNIQDYVEDQKCYSSYFEDERDNPLFK